MTMTDTWSPPTAPAADPGAANGGNERVDSGSPLSSDREFASPHSTSVHPPAASMSSGAGSWDRHAYYSAEGQIADGLTFLNNHGGDGSGVFDEYVLLSWSCMLSNLTVA